MKYKITRVGLATLSVEDENGNLLTIDRTEMDDAAVIQSIKDRLAVVNSDAEHLGRTFEIPDEKEPKP